MTAVRHTSVSANVVYQQRTSASESARVDALLGGAATAQREKNRVETENVSRKNEATAANTTPSLSQKHSPADFPGTTRSLASCEIVEVSSNASSTSSSSAPNNIVLENSEHVPYTQIQMDYLENEMREIQNGRIAHHRSPPREFLPPTNRGRGEFRRERHGRHGTRHSLPMMNSYRSHPYDHGNRVIQNRPVRARPSSMGGRPRPSAREREIMSMRQRLQELQQEEEMESFPYRSTEHEQDCLYSDYIDEFNF